MNHLHVYMHPLFLSVPPAPSPSHPSGASQGRAELLVPCAVQRPPTVRFTQDSVGMSVPLSQCIPLAAFPSMSTRLVLHLCVSIPDPQTCWERILICLKVRIFHRIRTSNCGDPVNSFLITRI